MQYFTKFIEEAPEFYHLLKERITAFVLLAIIASRARKEGLKINDGLEVGEALIGDYEIYGVSEQVYRTDKKYLETSQIITTRATTRGTVAKLVNSSIFDISRVVSNDLSNDQLTINQRSTNDHLTTNQEVRSKKEEERNNNIDTNEKKSVSSSETYKTSEQLERFIFDGETEQEKLDREWWEKTASELGYSVEETKRRFHQI